ncbi:hypothetical protein [Paracoccus sp. PARArs4]|uniref:hypothetical protein n=1 Tax=Paracoccus sp. PARArs4 TaxID=2853442 RepID=UPI0024A75242|nr:hypothetical protein [Paracoccus sp. PARArs4]
MIGGTDLQAMTAALFAPGLVVLPDAVNPAPQPIPLQHPNHPMMAADDLPDPKTGCIIGVIDDAIPFAHERLRRGAARSRVAALWAMDVAHDPQGPGLDLPAGIELRGARISGWLRDLERGRIATEDGIYRAAGILDMNRQTTHSAAFAAGHGAAVSLLAAGFAQDDPRGADLPLIGVNLPPRILADTTGTLAPGVMIAAVLFVLTRARRLCRQIEAVRGLPANSVRLPVVLNISLGLTAGPRDGSSLVERFLDAVSGFDAPDLGPVRIVLPSGNHRMGRLRADLPPGRFLGWQLPPDDRTVTPLEIWGPPLSALPASPMQVTLQGPGLPPTTTGFTAPGQVARLRDPSGAELARAYYTPTPRVGSGWRECVTLILNPTCPERPGDPWLTAGLWSVAVAPGAQPGDYALSLQRDEVLRGFPREARQSRLHDPAYRDLAPDGFPIPYDPAGSPSAVQRADTINAYATGTTTLRAGAVDRLSEGCVIYNSLIGQRQGGDVMVRVDSAPFDGGMIVRGRGSGSFGIMSGTSLAAPWAARWLAQAMAAGARPADRAAMIAMAPADPRHPDPILPGPPAPAYR